MCASNVSYSLSLSRWSVGPTDNVTLVSEQKSYLEHLEHKLCFSPFFHTTVFFFSVLALTNFPRRAVLVTVNSHCLPGDGHVPPPIHMKSCQLHPITWQTYMMPLMFKGYTGGASVESYKSGPGIKHLLIFTHFHHLLNIVTGAAAKNHFHNY